MEVVENFAINIPPAGTPLPHTRCIPLSFQSGAREVVYTAATHIVWSRQQVLTYLIYLI